MKQKSNWLKELGMSFFLLGAFGLIRFILIAQGSNFHISDEVVAGILLAAAVIAVVLTYLMEKLRKVFSFSFDTWILTIVGLFLWDLQGSAGSILWFAFAIFGLLTVTSAWTAMNLFWKKQHTSEQAAEMMELHDFINRCLGIKFLAMALGALLIEKILVPIIAG
ncbi:MAG: hypothetical protein HY931_00335 [Candidatus Falkowbacteria bacterium]|nr:MAG: hypothetical protein HY931_00335 [Candidatus Falkowbacteria bacterium]